MAALTLLAAGCTTMELPRYQPQPGEAVGNEVKADQEGLAIAIEPFTDADKCSRFFGVNLLEQRILAVYVVAENRGSGSSYLISRDRAALAPGRLAEGTIATGRRIGSTGGGEGVAMTGALLISPLLQFTGFKMISDAQVIKHNMEVQALDTTTLSPGRRAHGFLYFQLPPEGALARDWRLRFRASELGAKREIALNLPIHLPETVQ